MTYKPDPKDLEGFILSRMVLRYGGDPAKNYADAITPYLAALLELAIPVPVRGIGDSISSDRVRVYFDPDHMNANDPGDNAARLLHEIGGHQFAGHIDRFAAGGLTNPTMGNVAGDIACNQFCFAVAAKHPNAVRPGGVRFANADGSPLAPAARDAAIRQTRWLHPLLYGFPEGLSMEEYYALLLQQAAKREEEKRQQQQDDDGGGGPPEDGASSPGSTSRGAKGSGGQGDGEPDDADGDDGSDDADGTNGNGPQSDDDGPDGSQDGQGSSGASPGDSGPSTGSGAGSQGGGSPGSGGGSSGGGSETDSGGTPGSLGAALAGARDPVADALKGTVGKGSCGACGGDKRLSDHHRELAIAQHGELPEGASETELRAARKAVAEAVVAHAAQHGRGSVPAGLLRIAEGHLAPPRVRWERVLAGLVQGIVAGAAAGGASATYTRLSRRSSPGIVFPGSVADRVDVAVVADTSGSMGGDDLRRVLSETRGVLELPAVNRVWWIATDATADKATHIRSVRAARDRLVGGGGTDMGAGLNEAAKVRPRVALTVVVTDGDTGWPKVAPKCGKVVVVRTRPSACPTPAWVHRVIDTF